MDDSAIMCDGIIQSYDDEAKAIPTIFNEEKTIFKTQNVCILLALLITVALLIAVSVYC